MNMSTRQRVFGALCGVVAMAWSATAQVEEAAPAATAAEPAAQAEVPLESAPAPAPLVSATTAATDAKAAAKIATDAAAVATAAGASEAEAAIAARAARQAADGAAAAAKAARESATAAAGTADAEASAAAAADAEAAAKSAAAAATEAESKAQATAAAEASSIVGQLVTAAEWLKLERERNGLVTSALNDAQATGIRKLYQGREVAEVTRRSAVIDALKRNLSVQRTEFDVAIADAALNEARAVFEPVIALSVDHHNSKAYERFELIDKAFRRSTELIIDQNGAPHNAVLIPRGIIEYIGFDRPRPQGLYPTSEDASVTNIFGSETHYAYNLNVTQALPWGADLQFNYRLQDRETFFQNNAGARAAGLTTFGSYERPWSATLDTSVFLPLPWTRNFGTHSAREVSINLGRIGLARAEQAAKAVINQTLRDVDVAYFELVRSVLVLDITLANRRQLADLVQRTTRLLNSQIITAQSKAEVDAEYARVTGEVEQAWANYLRASNNLGQLTDQDARRLHLPIGYSQGVTEDVEFRFDAADPAFGDASRNPEYLARQQDLASAEVVKQQAANDARPDLRADVTITLQQLDEPFGYGGFEEAMAETFDPDKRGLSAGVTFIRPWANRAARSARDIAALEVSAQSNLLQQQLNRLNRELEDALVDHASARSRVEIAARNLELQRIAYEKALTAQARRTVTEFELVTQSRELLAANQRWIEALVAAKQSEARVLAAAGVLPQRYGENTALNDIDRQRLTVLAEQYPMKFFAGGSQ